MTFYGRFGRKGLFPSRVGFVPTKDSAPEIAGARCDLALRACFELLYGLLVTFSIPSLTPDEDA